MNKSYVYIFLAAIFWGTMGIFTNGLGEMGLSSVQISLLRSLTSLVFISMLILCRGTKLLRINLRDIWMFVGSGIISYFLFNICYFTAIREIGVAVASVLLYTSPIFVMIMACVLFGEKMTKKKVLCLILAVCGCALVSGILSGEVGSISVFGMLIALAAGFTYALYSIFSTYALRKYNSLTVTFYTFLFGAIAALFIGDPINTFKAIANPEGVAWSLSLGVISGAVPYFLYTLGLSKIEASHAALLATVEPVVAVIIGIFLFREPADAFTVLGIILVLSSSVILNGRVKKK